jgi:hypothetical protein
MTQYRVDEANVRDSDTGEIISELVGSQVQIVTRDTTAPFPILDETQSIIPESLVTVTPVYTTPAFWIDTDAPEDLYLDWLDTASGKRGPVEFEAVLRDAAIRAAESAEGSALSSAASATAAQDAVDLATGPTEAVVEAVLADTLGTPDNAIAQTMADEWVDGVKPELYGAVGDGVTNDTAAIAAAISSGAKIIRLAHGKTYLIDPDVIELPSGSRLVGGFNRGYSNGATGATRVVVADSGGTTGIKMNMNSVIEGINVEAATLPDYYRGDWVAGTGRALVGIDADDETAVIGCGAFGFETGILAGKSVQIDRANVGKCKHGIRTDGPDGWIANSTINFCTDAGIKISGNFWRIVNNRVEWNARYGLDAAAEITIVANLFDRNGWAGVNLPSGAWGAVITGNYFCRNGAGGDGTVGRWGWAVVGNPGYVATTSAQSCHIQLAFQRGVTITGNRYRAGSDDTGTGTSSPSHIYAVNGSSGSTPPSALTRIGNPGEYVSGGVSGYATAPGPYGDASIAAGTDTALVGFINTGGQRFPTLVTATGYTTTRDQAASASSVTITPEKLHGVVFLRGSRSGSGVQSVIYFGEDASPGTNKYAMFENKQGAMVSSVSRGADGTIVVTFGTTYFTNYSIIYSG